MKPTVSTSFVLWYLLCLFFLGPIHEWAFASEAVRRSPDENSQNRTYQAIEKYEKEKLARLKRQIGRKFMAFGVDRPLAFFQSPDDPEKKIWIKGKEPIQIVDVVRNHPGTMYFYKVRFESGSMGYLSADGPELEIRIGEGRLIPLSRPKASKRPENRGTKSPHNVSMASQAVQMVKNHLTGKDPITGERKTVEKRMLDAKADSMPALRWRYEAKEIDDGRYRVTQFVEGGPSKTSRTWIVDLHPVKVIPENASAKKLY